MKLTTWGRLPLATGFSGVKAAPHRPPAGNAAPVVRAARNPSAPLRNRFLVARFLPWENGSLLFQTNPGPSPAGSSRSLATPPAAIDPCDQ